MTLSYTSLTDVTSRLMRRDVRAVTCRAWESMRVNVPKPPRLSGGPCGAIVLKGTFREAGLVPMNRVRSLPALEKLIDAISTAWTATAALARRGLRPRRDRDGRRPATRGLRHHLILQRHAPGRSLAEVPGFGHRDHGQRR